MKPILGWLRSNLAIVILSAVIVVSLPTAYVVSSQMNASLRRDREKEANKATSDLASLKFTYVLEPIAPGMERVEFHQEAPNRVLNEWFSANRDRLKAGVAAVIAEAERINRGEGADRHEPLVRDLFPKPTPEAEPIKTIEMSRLIAGDPDSGVRSVYQRLFDRYRVGGPADASRLATELGEQLARFKDRVRAETGRAELTVDEQEELNRLLVGYRIGTYQQRARELSLYGEPSEVLPKTVPVTTSATPPKVWQCFLWQWDYWVISDVLRALSAANVDSGGRPTDIPESVVKRLKSIEMRELPIGAESTSDTSGTGGGSGAAATAGAVPVHMGYSVTGRHTSAGNQLYDVRHVTIRVIVDSARLLQMIDAIQRTNFMTVIGVDLADVDVWRDLDNGYFYGDQHVVEATVKIESIWLRSWTSPLMPDAVKGTLAVAGSAEGEGMGDMGGDRIGNEGFEPGQMREGGWHPEQRGHGGGRGPGGG